MNDSVVIIGAGMAGLTLGAYLSRAGKKVQIFEQHTLPGGYISSFPRGGYTFPAGPPSFGSSGIIFPILKELGLDGKRHFIPAGHQISWGSHDIPLRSPQQARRDLAEHFPSEQSGLARYFRWVEIGGRGFYGLFESGLMFGRNVVPALLRTLLRHPLFPWAGLAARGQTNRSLHKRYFRDPLLKDMLDELGYPVMSGQNTLGLWVNYFYDTYVPANGMQAFANIFMRFIRDHGGEVHLGSGVQRIQLENGRAVGVILADGTPVKADVVVSAADLHHTIVDLIGPQHIPAATMEKLENTRPSESVFALYLGLRGSPELDAHLERFRESHVRFTSAQGEHLQIILLSKDDPAVAPEGKHALYIARLEPYEEWQPLKADRAAYCERKAAVAEEILAVAEEFIPGLRQHIEMQDAASPLTFERYTSNWRGGTTGWNWNPEVTPRFNIAKDLPIEQFYAVGHYAFNPGGVPTAMITAWYIAQEILKKGG